MQNNAKFERQIDCEFIDTSNTSKDRKEEKVEKVSSMNGSGGREAVCQAG